MGRVEDDTLRDLLTRRALAEVGAESLQGLTVGDGLVRIEALLGAAERLAEDMDGKRLGTDIHLHLMRVWRRAEALRRTSETIRRVGSAALSLPADPIPF